MKANRARVRQDDPGNQRSWQSRRSSVRVDSSYLRGIHLRISSLARDTTFYDFRGYERSGAPHVRKHLGEAVLDLVSHAVDVAGDLFFACEQGEETTPGSIQARQTTPQNFELRMDRLVSTSVNLDLASHVADVAFVARAELSGRLLVLQRAAPGQSARSLIVNYESAIRRVKKSLTALDAVLAPLLQARPLLDYVRELDRSLRVRTAYFEFLQAMHEVGAVGEHNVHRALRAAGTRIAMLIGKDVYGEMRMNDRFRLTDLQEGILDWMRSDLETEAGLRLWEDLLCTLEIFREISRREELRAHDLERLVESRIALSSLDEPVSVVLGRPSALALLGLDGELDDALTGKNVQNRGQLVALLRRLERHILPQQDPLPSADPFA